MSARRKIFLTLAALGWIPTLVVTGLVAQHAGRTPVMVTRLYTGEDGKTHAQRYEVPLGEQRGATEVAEPIAVESLQFRRTSPDYVLDFHTAPRRQYVITLAGQSEVELGDGTKIRLYPGHILLAEDTEGQGHISRAIGDKDRISLFIPLADE
jgi:hypothetical protein